MDRQLIAWLIHAYCGGRVVLTQEDCGMAMELDYEEQENEAGEVVLTSEPIRRPTDLGKGTCGFTDE